MIRTILIVLALASAADAQILRRFRQPRQVVRVEQPDVVVVQEAQPVLPVQLAFVLDNRQPSAYGAVDYTPAGIRARQDAEYADLRQQMAELTQLVTRLARAAGSIRSEFRVQPPDPQPPIEGAAAVQHACGSCHTGTNAAGDFTLAKLQDRHHNRLAAILIEDGKMPKDANGDPVDLPEAERSRLARAVESLVK